ncbi:uncharacterized protein LOC122013438 [Zingiber officinale]|uniref:uncharacterized protein LOC122013438 n=1 Tax=Zingiber officinale TaxID=94328 RepID=UPI001C4B74C4|nr:uncharacterized protein LOC122013438 [Zingiber officinale]
MPSSRRELQGPRPPPLTVNKASGRGKKPATGGTGSCSGRDPVVIVYVDSPKVIHTRPQDFMSLVQRLTGKSSSSSSSSHVTHCGSNRSGHGKRSSSPAMIEVDGERGEGVGGDSLLLTLGSSPIFCPSVFESSPDYTSFKVPRKLIEGSKMENEQITN